MTPGVLDLSREEVRRVASVLEALVGGDTYEVAARRIGIGKTRIVEILARPASHKVLRSTLEKIARAAGGLFTVEQLIGGHVELACRPGLASTARRTRGAVVVRRTRRS